MSEALAAPAPIGHNSLLAIYAEQNTALPDYLAREHLTMLDRHAELVSAFAEAAPLVDTDDLERAMTDLGGKLAKFLKDAAAQKKIVKDPVQAGVKIVDDFFTRMVAPIEAAKSQIERRVNAYKDEKRAAAERQRQAAERAAQAAAEEARRKQAEAQRLADEEDRARAAATSAEEKAAAEALAQERLQAEREASTAAINARQAQAESTVKPAKTETVKGDTGAASIQRTTWTGEIEDLEALDVGALRSFISRAALDGAVRAYAVQFKDTKPLAGARIFAQTKTAFR